MLNSYEIANKLKANHEEVVGALKSLESADYLVLKQKKESRFQVTKEGAENADKGLPEYRLLNVLLA